MKSDFLHRDNIFIEHSNNVLPDADASYCKGRLKVITQDISPRFIESSSSSFKFESYISGEADSIMSAESNRDWLHTWVGVVVGDEGHGAHCFTSSSKTSLKYSAAVKSSPSKTYFYDSDKICHHLSNEYSKFDLLTVWAKLFSSFSQLNGSVVVEKKFRQAIDNYMDILSDETEVSSSFVQPSIPSMVHLIRFSNFINFKRINLYIDISTGFFGFYLKNKRKEDGVLTVLVDSSGVVDYSVALSPRDRRSVTDFTGRVKFGKDVEDSVEIRRLFKLLEPNDEYSKY
jgi:hypothetical protein